MISSFGRGFDSLQLHLDVKTADFQRFYYLITVYFSYIIVCFCLAHKSSITNQIKKQKTWEGKKQLLCCRTW